MTAFSRVLIGLTAATCGAQPARLSVKAEIVLSPEFCATKRRESIAVLDVLKVGKQACEQLFAALTPVFSELRKIEVAPTEGTRSDHITLIPKFVEVSATKPPWPGMKAGLTVLVEWTIFDKRGKPVWLYAVAGSTKSVPSLIHFKKWQHEWIEAAMDDLAQTSAAKIATAPEVKSLP